MFESINLDITSKDESYKKNYNRISDVLDLINEEFNLKFLSDINNIIDNTLDIHKELDPENPKAPIEKMNKYLDLVGDITLDGDIEYSTVAVEGLGDITKISLSYMDQIDKISSMIDNICSKSNEIESLIESIDKKIVSFLNNLSEKDAQNNDNNVRFKAIQTFEAGLRNLLPKLANVNNNILMPIEFEYNLQLKHMSAELEKYQSDLHKMINH